MNDVEENNIELSIIIPGFNEGEIIESNLRKIIDYLNQNNFPLEIIFINDGSTDSTLNSLADLKISESRFDIISYKAKTTGRGYALRRGFEKAKGNYILSTESDMNYGVEIIMKLYNSIKDLDSDIVVAYP